MCIGNVCLEYACLPSRLPTASCNVFKKIRTTRKQPDDGASAGDGDRDSFSYAAGGSGNEDNFVLPKIG
jgi:hypothetical protein